HHLLLDGWSLGLVHRDLLRAHGALERGEAVAWAPAAPYRDYVRWLAARDLAVSREFWRNYLVDYETPASLPRLEAPAGEECDAADHTVSLGPELSAALRAMAAQASVTLNTLL